jgi:hypothetical protein
MQEKSRNPSTIFSRVQIVLVQNGETPLLGLAFLNPFPVLSRQKFSSRIV